MTETVANVAKERAEGGRPGRLRALLAAIAAGFIAAVVAYRLFRSAEEK